MPVSSARSINYIDRIDINEPNAVRHWATEFNIPEQTLRAIVATTGFMVDDIREELANRRRSMAAASRHPSPPRTSSGDIPN